MGNSAKTVQSCEMGCETLDITLVKELTGFEKVNIAFVQLALFNFLVLINLLIMLVQLSVARIYQTMRIP